MSVPIRRTPTKTDAVSVENEHKNQTHQESNTSNTDRVSSRSKGSNMSCVLLICSTITLATVLFYMVRIASLYPLDRRHLSTQEDLQQLATSAQSSQEKSSVVNVDNYRQSDNDEAIFHEQSSEEKPEVDALPEVIPSDLDAMDYTNPVTDTFCKSFYNYYKKHNYHFVSHDDETFESFLKRLKRRQKKGRKLFASRKDDGNDPSWRRFYRGIWQYALYDPTTDVIDNLLTDLETQPVKIIAELDEGTQMKLLLTLKDGTKALMKPMRFSREQETNPDHFYFSDFERHTAEIAAFHLDRVLGFYRVPPTVGRVISIELDFNYFENTTLDENWYISPAENKCFYAECELYCHPGHAICGNPDEFEASLSVFLPGQNKTFHRDESNPWKRSYTTDILAPWEHNDHYCHEVRQRDKKYAHGRRLLDIIDTHVFDFLMGNMDRHSLDLFRTFGTDTFPIWLDNGKGLGKSKEDIFSILAPIRQCCQIRLSTLAKLVKLYSGSDKLSDLMRDSLMDDPLESVMTEPHLDALDRRVVHVLTAVSECVDKKGSFRKVVIDDGHM